MVPSRFSLSGTALKRLALVSMLLDHLGASLLEAGRFTAAVPPAATLFRLDRCLRWAGRLAFPLYCFLLVEGFVHTRSRRRYAGRMLLFALLSEVPFDLAFFRTPFYWEHQNVYWTLLLGLCALGCLQRFGPQSVPGAAGAFGCAVLAELLRTDYGALGVLLVMLLFFFREDRAKQCLLGALAVCYELPAPLAMLPAFYYNGTRGRCAPWEAWAFYLFYPVHLAVLAALTNTLF